MAMLNNAHIVSGRTGERLVVVSLSDGERWAGARFRLENDSGKWWFVDVPPAHCEAIATLLMGSQEPATEKQEEAADGG